MDLLVKGKNVFLTGGGDGIGVLVAEMLAADGANIAAADMNADKVKETAAKVEAMGQKALWFRWT